MKSLGRVCGALALIGYAGTAVAEADQWRLDVATELDSNIHRVDDVARAQTGAMSRLALRGQLERGGPQLAGWGDLQLQLRKSLASEFATEDAALVHGKAGLRGPLAAHAEWMVQGSGLGYTGTAQPSDVLQLMVGAADASLLLGGETAHRAWMRGGMSAVAVPTTRAASYTSTELETGWGWSLTDEEAVSQWQASVSYQRSLRVFDGPGGVANCVVGLMGCATETEEPRRDDVHTLALSMQHSRRVIWSAGYSLTWQRSTLERLSSLRHTLLASCTGKVAGKLYATARVRLQFDRYPDGVTLYGNVDDAASTVLLESDQRNEGMVLLAYRATKALSVEGLLFVWSDGFGVGDRQYQRVLASLGLGYTFGAAK